MLVKHLRREFYDLLFGKRVLIMANIDVDSVCTTKILTELLKIDGIPFSLCPVDGVSQIKQAFSDYSETVNVILLINCGIAIDIRAFFDNPGHKLVFILDSHRPVHVANFYDETNQVRLLSLNDPFQEVPAFDDIFRPDDGDDDDDEEDEEEDEDQSSSSETEDEDAARSGEDGDIEDGDRVVPRGDRGPRDRPPSRKRKRMDYIEKRRRRREWIDRRNELIFNYTQFSYFTIPSCLVALELSWAVSRGDMQYVWWACIALTDSYVLDKLPRAEYVKRAAELSLHIAREARSTTTPKDALKVKFEKELCFYLYRHWNLYDSIKMTPFSSVVLKTWSLKGEAKYHEMLGEMGFPQNECRQKYSSMDIRCRKKIKEAFADPMMNSKYRFEDLFIGSFLAEMGFRPATSSTDCQLACLALLENPDKDKSLMDNFLASMSSLSKKQFDLLDTGIELAKVHVIATFTQVQDFININALGPRGGFLFAVMPEGSPNACYFRNPNFLTILAQFTQRAAVAQARSRRWGTLPFVMMVPQVEEYWAVIGIKPISFEMPKNLFGKLFETLADKLRGVVLQDFMDPHIVLVKKDQKDKFLQLLDACMI